MPISSWPGSRPASTCSPKSRWRPRPQMCRKILEAERRTGRRVDVAFNYRFSPTSKLIKQVLLSGVIGEIASVDFHWYLDTQHGADYFRRWHAFQACSGSLFVHKATHHFDLLNWYLGLGPERDFCARRASPLRRQRPVSRPALQDLPACRYLPLLFRHRRRPVARHALRGPVARGRLFPRRLRVPRGDRHFRHDERGDPLRQRRAGFLFAEHLHADRGLSSRLQRHEGPRRDQAV